MSKYERIKELCKDRGVTITGLEKELGFARGSLSKIDKNKPSYERLEKLANYFGVPIEINHRLAKNSKILCLCGFFCLVIFKKLHFSLFKSYIFGTKKREAEKPPFLISI